MTGKPQYVIVHVQEDGSVEVDGFPGTDLLFEQAQAAELGDSYRVAELRYVEEKVTR